MNKGIEAGVTEGVLKTAERLDTPLNRVVLLAGKPWKGIRS